MYKFIVGMCCTSLLLVCVVLVYSWYVLYQFIVGMCMYVLYYNLLLVFIVLQFIVGMCFMIDYYWYVVY